MGIVVNDQQIKHVCSSMLGVQGTPSFCMNDNRQEIYTILSKCDSIFELMCFIGMCHYMQGEKFDVNNKLGYHVLHDETIGGSGIVIAGSELYMKSRQGYYYLIVMPQYKKIIRSKYNKKLITLTHDFGIFLPKLYTAPGERHQILCAVEADGYHYHKDRRDKDATRDSSVPYPVIRILQERDNVLSWFRYLDPGSVDYIQESVKWAY